MAEDLELLKSKIRPVTEDDKLPVFSYSKLDLFDQCPFRWKLKYIDKNYPNDNSIALEMGTLIHRILEEKGNLLIQNKNIDYEELHNKLFEGFVDVDGSKVETIVGLNQIKKKFFEDYYENDNASGRNYEEKVDLFFNKVLKEEMGEEGWSVYKCEHPFEFVYKYGENEDGSPKEVKIHGFIDRVDQNSDGDNRVIDYKTSKKSYDPKKVVTALQQSIYSMAIFNDFGKLPIQHRYDFIFIDEYQDACTKGYIKRACKKLDKLLNAIDEAAESDKYKPSPCPLCHWCSYSSTNPLADGKTKNLCPYFSLWTPTNKTYQVNQVWEHDPKATNILTNNSAVQSSPNKSGRKLVF